MPRSMLTLVSAVHSPGAGVAQQHAGVVAVAGQVRGLGRPPQRASGDRRPVVASHPLPARSGRGAVELVAGGAVEAAGHGLGREPGDRHRRGQRAEVVDADAGASGEGPGHAGTDRPAARVSRRSTTGSPRRALPSWPVTACPRRSRLTACHTAGSNPAGSGAVDERTTAPLSSWRSVAVPAAGSTTSRVSPRPCSETTSPYGVPEDRRSASARTSPGTEDRVSTVPAPPDRR